MSATSKQIQLWVEEAHDRLDAYDRGELDAVDAEDVFEQLDELMALPQNSESLLEEVSTVTR